VHGVSTGTGHIVWVPTPRTLVSMVGVGSAQAGSVVAGRSICRLTIAWCGEIAQVAECGEMVPTRSRSGVPLALPQCNVPRSLPRARPRPAIAFSLMHADRVAAVVFAASSLARPRKHPSPLPRLWGLQPDQGNR
jgi:hypothetical protein